jgi:hypothetical protein
MKLQKIALYYGMISEMEGLIKNSLIIFSGENGIIGKQKIKKQKIEYKRMIAYLISCSVNQQQ